MFVFQMYVLDTKTLHCVVKYKNQTDILPKLAVEILPKINIQRIIKSMLVVNVEMGKYKIIARSIIVKLLLSDFNSQQGITVCADMPFGQNNLLNISQPAVLRTYYGQNVHANSPTQWTRVTYGPTSVSGALSMDPRNFSTKAMPQEMFSLGNYFKTYMKKEYEKLGMCGKSLIVNLTIVQCWSTMLTLVMLTVSSHFIVIVYTIMMVNLTTNKIHKVKTHLSLFILWVIQGFFSSVNDGL